MSAPPFTIEDGGATTRRPTGRRLGTAQGRRNHRLSSTANTMGSEPDDDGALAYAGWFANRRAERFDFDLAVSHLDALYGKRLHEAEVSVSRTRLPERKAEAQRRFDALRGEYDAALEAIRERSPGWRHPQWNAKRGILCSWPEEKDDKGRHAVTLRLTTAAKHVLVEATVAGDPELQSRVYAALKAILDVVDPEEEAEGDASLGLVQ